MTTPIPITDLTTASLDGGGIFDTLMRANKVHLQAEFDKGRIKGTEYATVYLGSLESVMRTSLEFIMQRQKVALEAELMAQQILLAQKEVEKADAAIALAQQQLLNTQAELAILQANQLKIPAEIAQIQAQTLLIGKQGEKVTDDLLTAAKQRLQLEAQTAMVVQQKVNLEAEALNIPKQGLLIDAQKGVQTQQALNLAAEKLLTDSKVLLTNQQKENAVKEGAVLVAQECKLRAEFDVLVEQKIKTTSEVSLLNQKTVTEKAQTMSGSADPDSVIGKQKLLYAAQTDGYKRDAEQKAATLLAETWKARRMTNDTEPSAHGLTNEDIRDVITKLKLGIGAPAAHTATTTPAA